MTYCDRCEQWFPHDRALVQHKEDSNSHWPCDDCNLDFESADVRKQHYEQSRNHHYCTECDRHFTLEARIHHMSAKHSYCRMHDKIFISNARLQLHYRQNPDHHYCIKCECDFDGEDELWDHAVQDHHACRMCRKIFDDYQELQEHDRDKHKFCTECNTGFQNATNMQHHLSSKHHQPATMSCPGGDCTKSFVSYGALLPHVESGACPPGMTRDRLNRLMIVRKDTRLYITNPDRLIEGPLDGRYEPPSPVETWATERSWNGEAYECFLCGWTFETLGRLNKHLQSPRHADKVYRCPKADCRAEFSRLSGLCQHVEGGTCGVTRFRRVRSVMDSLMRGVNALTM